MTKKESASLENIRNQNKRAQEKFESWPKEKQERWRYCAKIHSMYGFELWDMVNKKLEENNIPPPSLGHKLTEECVVYCKEMKTGVFLESLVNEFVETIKSSKDEEDKEFIDSYYSQNTKLCKSLIEDEFVENLNRILEN